MTKDPMSAEHSSALLAQDDRYSDTKTTEAPA
jgi:hypothetical protein